MSVNDSVNQSVQKLKSLAKECESALFEYEQNKKTMLKQRVENIDKNLSDFDSDLEEMEKTIKLLDSQLEDTNKAKLDARRVKYSQLANKIRIY